MSFARELIADGEVPPLEAFFVEGMFSEHDLGIAGAACESIFCLQSAVAVAPSSDGTPSGWMQLSMSSNVDPETYERPSQSLILTVDVSGSMGWSSSVDDPSPGNLSRALLLSLSEQLNVNDQVAIVTYGSSVRTALDFTGGSDYPALRDAINALSTDGSTNMEAGLVRAYQLAETVVGQRDETRVVLFTDVRPNVGATGTSEFEQIVAAGAEAGVGISVLGLGQYVGIDIAAGMSHIRGANGFTMFDFDDVDQFIEDNWPWFVSPIAYDMALSIAVTAGVTIAGAYGFPASDSDQEVGFDVSTIFLSKRRGALLLRVEQVPNDGTGDDGTGDETEEPVPAEFPSFQLIADLGYQTPADEARTDTLDVIYDQQTLDERGHYYEQVGTAKTVALAVLVTSMREAAEVYGEDADAAVEIMTAARDRFAADLDTINAMLSDDPENPDDTGDPALAVELALADALLALMTDGAPQASLP